MEAPVTCGRIELVTALAYLTLAAVSALLVGGWAYSQGLRRDVLTVGERQEPPSIHVRALTRDTITLQARSPRQDIGHPGTLGLFWDGGYSQVHEVVAAEEGRITRVFEHLKGDLPPLCGPGPMEACPAVSLGSYAFPDDPSDVGLRFSEVAYPSPLGPMPAWAVASGTERWVVHVHGWAAHRREAIRLLRTVDSAGWGSLVISYRNDAGVPSDPSGLHRFGVTEWEDVQAAVGHLIEAGAEEIVLVGYSTGAAHIMSFLERSELSSRIGGLVFDSPNIDLATTIRAGSRGARFPLLNIPVTRLTAEFGMWISELRWGVDWDRTNYLQRADETVTVPVLLFHGSADRRVPVTVSRSLARRLGDLVTYIETPAAGHVMSWNADVRGYERALREFLDRL